MAFEPGLSVLVAFILALYFAAVLIESGRERQKLGRKLESLKLILQSIRSQQESLRLELEKREKQGERRS